MKREFRKPLIVMSPKSLLRHPKAISTMDELANGTFQEVIDDSRTAGKAAAAVERVVLCSGKVYYDIMAELEKMEPAQAAKLAIVRVEQLYPFPAHRLVPVMKTYANAKDIVWCQEEPKNMGSWFFMKPRLDEMLEDAGLEKPVRYAGRDERASPAMGSDKVHVENQLALVQDALGLTGNKSTATAKAKKK